MDPALHGWVLMRDGGCVARFVGNSLDEMRWPMLRGLPAPDLCRNGWGSVINAYSISLMELDHVEPFDEPDFGRKPPDHPAYLWTLCSFHHRGTVAGHAWATKTAVREAAPVYIAAANERAAARGLILPGPIWWDEEAGRT